jgi:hypothetical protein
MKKNINQILILIILLSAGMAGCKKQLDINRNTNAVTESNINAELILPNALHGVGVQTATGYGWLANWMGYWSPSGSYNPSTEESTYNITNSFAEGKWAGIYNVLFDLDVVEKKAQQSNQQFYRGIAIIMKAHLFQNLVDLYGNVPYSQAFKPLEFPSPAYDKAEDIYANLQVQLDSAVSLMEDAHPTAHESEIDIVYGGDTDLWLRLANTIKLRLLIRLSEVNPNPTAEIAKIESTGGVLGAGETAEVNPGYVNDNLKQNPFYAAFGLTPSGGQANEYYRANAYIIETLRNSSDPRMNRYFLPAKNPTNPSVTYVGTVYGSNPDVAFGGDQTSNIGAGLARSATQGQWILTSVEALFLRAEAVARGWIAGDPKAAYEAAVRESFSWLAVPGATAAATTYLTESNIAKWDNAGTTTADRVRFIVRQKYLSLVGINPLEAWNDYRRLGVPADIPLSVNAQRGSRIIPVRLLYPSAEVAVNAASLQAQGSITPQTKIFWDK